MNSPALMNPSEVEAGRALLVRLREGLGQVLFGQDELLDLTVIALAARGNLLIEGMPGLGKTELVKALGQLLGLDFRRIQFTPDLLPSDITGGPVLEEKDGTRQFVFREGPLFAHLVLADEINRASPKTQSALLEAMQERRVTVLGETHTLPEPFFVLATQNPIELEGTYPLPEAQLDRFLFKVDVPPVGADVMAKILTNRRRGTPPLQEQALSHDAMNTMFDAVDRVFLPQPIAHYIGRLVEESHRLDGQVRFGASPRAAIAMAESARASALLDGRPNVDFSDVARVAVAALSHRLVLDHAARLDGTTPRDIVGKLLAQVDETAAPLPGDLA